MTVILLMIALEGAAALTLAMWNVFGGAKPSGTPDVPPATEKRWSEGLSNVLSYSYDTAVRAAGGRADE